MAGAEPLGQGHQYSASPFTPSPPLGAERLGVRWGIPGRSPMPTSPSHRFAMGPSLSALKGGEGLCRGQLPLALRSFEQGAGAVFDAALDRPGEQVQEARQAELDLDAVVVCLDAA